MQFCVKCGSANEDDSRFCIACGNPIEYEDAPAAPAVASPAPRYGQGYTTPEIGYLNPVPAAAPESPAASPGVTAPVSALAPAAGVVAAQGAPHDRAADAGQLRDMRDAVGDVAARLDGIEESIAALADRFDDKIARNEHEAAVLKQVSAEVEEYRDGLYEKLTMPLVRDMVEVRSGIQALLARNGSQVAADEVRVFADMLADALAKNGVQVVASQPGDEFLTFKHKAVGKVPTGDASKHGLVAQVEGESYRMGDQYIAPALVKVYSLEPDAGDAPARDE